jgi:imidazolonepropionase-like amidohydrolase
MKKKAKTKARCILLLLLCVTLFAPGAWAEDKALGQILIRNVQIFDGMTQKLSSPTNVLIVGNVIKEISDSATPSAQSKARIIDGAGRVLMPGLIDSHVHLSFATIPMSDLRNSLPSYVQVVAVAAAKGFLMRGVTTVRDMGGPVFGLKRGIDEGKITGPRIYPSGTLLSQTGGHGDLRYANEKNPRFGGERAEVDQNNVFRVVDGVSEVLAAARENIRFGASQVKLAAGGGYGSPTDPIDSTQFTFDELKAAVNAAEDYGTYVTVHAYLPKSVNRAIDAGVKVIEHGQLLDEKTLKRMADEGIWLSTQPFTVCNEPQLSASSNAKLSVVCKGTGFMYETIKKFPNLKVTYGTDIFNDAVNINKEIQWMARLMKWYTPGEVLVMATGNAGELLKLSGNRNPYPGDLGVIKEGALADVLLVDGNPLDDITVVGDIDNLRVIIKDGKVYKNTL